MTRGIDLLKDKKINKLFEAFVWIGITLFFLLLWYKNPIGIYPDSGSYMSMQPGREPVYPLFLGLLRRIFRESDTLVWLASSGALDTEKGQHLLRALPALHVSTLIQSLLAAVSCIYLGRSVNKTFHTAPFTGLMVYGLTLLPYVITPLFSASGMVIGRAVLTEGLAFPLFGFFMGAFIREMSGNSETPLPTLAFLLLLILTRNQMLIFLPVWGLCKFIRSFFPDFNKEQQGAGRDPLAFAKTTAGQNSNEDKNSIANKKRIIRTTAVIIISLFALMAVRSIANTAYVKVFSSGYEGASTGPYNMLTTLIYLGDESTASHIQDGELRALYESMVREAAQRELTYESAPGGLLEGAYHYEDAYDIIGFEIQQPDMFKAAGKINPDDGQHLNLVIQMADSIRGDIFKPLMGRYILNYIKSFLSGLTRSVAASGFIMGCYAFLVYVAAILLTICLFKKGELKTALFMLFSLIACFANAAGCALIIMCLSRYMIYNTPVFYIALLLGITAAFKGHPCRRGNESSGQA